MISPDEDDWLVNGKCNTALYITQYFNMLEFGIFCYPMITIIAIIYPSPSQIKGCIAWFTSPPQKPEDWRNSTVLSNVEHTQSFFSSDG